MSGSAVVVTGAASGIGAAVVARLLADGNEVHGWDLGTAVESAPGYVHRQVDVTDDAAVGAAVAAMGGMRGLVHAAAVFQDTARIDRVPPPVVARVLRVNVEGTVTVLRHVLPVLAGGGGGSAVVVASESGLRGSPGISAYAASKAATISLVRTAALEFAGRGVRVTAVAPGVTRTPMLAALAAEQQQALAEAVPLGRIAEPADIAGVVAFLLGDDARHLTGEVFAVNGGGTA